MKDKKGGRGTKRRRGQGSRRRGRRMRPCTERILKEAKKEKQWPWKQQQQNQKKKKKEENEINKGNFEYEKNEDNAE